MAANGEALISELFRSEHLTEEMKVLKRSSIIEELQESKDSGNIKAIVKREKLDYIIISVKPEMYTFSLKISDTIKDLGKFQNIKEDPWKLLEHIYSGVLPANLFHRIVDLYATLSYGPIVIAKIETFDSVGNVLEFSGFKCLRIADPLFLTTLNESKKNSEKCKRSAEDESDLNLGDEELENLIKKFCTFCSCKSCQIPNKRMKVDEEEEEPTEDVAKTVNITEKYSIEYSPVSSFDRTDDEISNLSLESCNENSAVHSFDKMDDTEEQPIEKSISSQSLEETASASEDVVQSQSSSHIGMGFESLRDIFKDALSGIKQEKKIKISFSIEEQFAFLKDDEDLKGNFPWENDFII